MSRKEGGRGLISVEDCILMERHENEVKRSRKENLMEKSMHSVFFSKSDFRDTRSWGWLRTGDLKKATEGTIMAAQEQAIRTRMIRHTVDKENVSPLCRMCGERNETVAHLVSECTMLAQKQYKEWRHDAICRVIHWRMCIDYGLDHADKWYEHRPETVVENEEIKLLWDMRIQTDKVLKHNKPDILLMDKIKRKVQIIDIACPFDARVLEKENEKTTNYQDLKWELKRIWNCQEITVIPIVIGALSTISKKHFDWLEKVSTNVQFEMMQKACLLGTARILRYVLDI